MTRPIRGGLGIVTVLLLIGGIAVLSMAPGGWAALPIVQFFRNRTAFEFAVMSGVPLVLVVVARAWLNACRVKSRPGSEAPDRWRWSGRRFTAAVALPGPFVLLGAWFLRGSDGFVVAGEWGLAYLSIGVPLGGLWLASAYHAFLSRGKVLLWALGGAGLVLSIVAVRAWDSAPGGSFLERARVRCADGSAYILLTRFKVRLRGLDYLATTRIGRVRRTLLGLTLYETVVETQTAFTDFGVYPESGCLVRPAGSASEDRGTLHASEDGFIAHVWGDMECDVAFDSRTGQGYGQWTGEWTRDGGPVINDLRREGMETLPPFRLLEAGGRPDPGDVGLLEAEAARKAEALRTGRTGVRSDESDRLEWATSERALEEALQSRNALVRAAAARVIRAGGRDLYPGAFEKER
jgi:hypothetical protein